ncbi:MAG: biotin--[acetyl-CoA-carboxylase] ligase [Deltaproteobacteria bacterium]|nr:biotin--[acetyl-CoA-carboxylase] ligase [Deltaproteobacteria bacterium]
MTIIHHLIDPGGPPVFSVDLVTSCLDVAWNLINENRLPVFGSVLARGQTAGRGRHGRTWSSPVGHLYSALRLPLSPPFSGTQAPLALALMLTQALESLDPGLQIAIKWPNDLMVGGRKAAGLLLENRNQALLAGFGLNLGSCPISEAERTPGAPLPGFFPASLGPPEKLWPIVAETLLKGYNDKFGRSDRPWQRDLLNQVEARLMYLGQTVTVIGPSSSPPVAVSEISGRLTGLDCSGALILESPLGLLTVWSGTLTAGP